MIGVTVEVELSAAFTATAVALRTSGPERSPDRLCRRDVWDRGCKVHAADLHCDLQTTIPRTTAQMMDYDLSVVAERRDMSASASPGLPLEPQLASLASCFRNGHDRSKLHPVSDLRGVS